MNLIPHPDSRFPQGLAVAASVTLANAGELLVDYLLDCEAEAVWMPQPSKPTRADGLWQTTCFELFLADPDSSSYFEFNFSPSGEWAAYGFTGYRAGMRDIDLPSPPLIKTQAENGLHLKVKLTLPAHLGCRNEWLAALTAVVEARDGSKCYWSLAHPPGKADFHHRDCFVLQLGAADRA